MIHLPENVSRIIKRLLKIFIILGVIFGILFTVLSSLGGDGDTYKESIESLITERIDGYEARVETLNQMRFFPYIGVDIEGLEIVNSETQEIVMAADKMQAAMGFFDAAFGTGKISSLHVQRLGVIGGYINPQTLLLERAAILTRENDAFFEANGQLGGKDFSVSMPMRKLGREANPRFAFFNDRAFQLNIEDIIVRGILARQSVEGGTINQLEITQNDLRLTGDLALKFGEAVNISDTLNADGGTPVAIDLTLEGSDNIFGTVSFESENQAGSLQKILTDLVQFWFGKAPAKFSNFEIKAQ